MRAGSPDPAAGVNSFQSLIDVDDCQQEAKPFRLSWSTGVVRDRLTGVGWPGDGAGMSVVAGARDDVAVQETERFSPGQRLSRGIAMAVAIVIIGCVVVFLVGGLVEGLGWWVLVVLAALVGGVGWLKWLQVRKARAWRRGVDVVHEVYVDALDRAECGDLTGAAERFEEAIAASSRLGGDAGQYVMVLLQGLASVRVAQGDLGRAVAVWQRAHALSRAEQGDDAAQTLATANGIAAVLLTQGEREAAGERYQDTLARCRRLLDAAHPETVTALNGVARSAPTPQVGPLHQQAAELYARILGPSHPDTLIAQRQAAPDDPAAACLAIGDLGGARALSAQALADCVQRHGEADPRTVAALNDLAMVLREQRDLTAAYRMYERAAELCGRLPGGPHPQQLAAGNGIAQVMLLQGDVVNAATELAAVLDGCLTRYGKQHPETAAARRNLERLEAPS
ncbi:tetratricopeptide repeat protein [Phytohabitans rumicis]|uniref:tetratricopeptide repeat protein n=1 Tax=Phytohabitans rumicis TaxID=1076125 RepID=UPI001564BCE6|nr:tetratricopeptide repeat protein [Phytohabitans rumicis]